jgi:hypothetical protein
MMTKGGPGQPKGGQKECKVCAHPGRQQIEVQLLNDVPYATIISQSARDFAGSVELTKPNLSTHKKNHLLTQPITRVVEGEDGKEEIQTYLTGAYESRSLVIPQAAIPEIPGLTEGLKIIIAAGLHNVLHNPGIVTVDKLIAAMELYRKIGGAGANELEGLMGSWGEVEKRKGEMKKTAKRTRKVTVEETTEETTAQAPSAPAGETIDAEWSEAELENLALPAPGGAE